MSTPRAWLHVNRFAEQKTDVCESLPYKCSSFRCKALGSCAKTRAPGAALGTKNEPPEINPLVSTSESYAEPPLPPLDRVAARTAAIHSSGVSWVVVTSAPGIGV